MFLWPPIDMNDNISFAPLTKRARKARGETRHQSKNAQLMHFHIRRINKCRPFVKLHLFTDRTRLEPNSSLPFRQLVRVRLKFSGNLPGSEKYPNSLSTLNMLILIDKQNHEHTQ